MTRQARHRTVIAQKERQIGKLRDEVERLRKILLERDTGTGENRETVLPKNRDTEKPEGRETERRGGLGEDQREPSRLDPTPAQDLGRRARHAHPGGIGGRSGLVPVLTHRSP